MMEPLTKSKVTVTPFPPRRKPPLKSETFRTLFRILSRCNDLSLPHQLSEDDGVHGAEKEVPTERLLEQTEFAGCDGGKQNECAVEKGLGGNLESIGSKDGGFSDTQLVIDEIENMMRVEDDQSVLNDKNTMDECIEFRELQELLMDDLVHTVQGNGEPVRDNNCDMVTMSLDENKGGGGDGVLLHHERNLNPQLTDLKECSSVQQQQVDDEENLGRNISVNVSLNNNVSSEALTSNSSEDKSSDSGITGLAVDHGVQQQSVILPETSVCTDGALVSPDYGNEDEREEGELAGDLEVQQPADTSSGYTLSLNMEAAHTSGDMEVAEEMIENSKIPTVEKDKLYAKESSATLFMKAFDSSNLEVEAKGSDRDDTRHKRKLVVYEDPILAEETCQQKEQKKRRITKKQKEVSGAIEHKKGDGKAKHTKGSAARNGVTCPVSSSSDLPLLSNNKDVNAGTNPGTTSKDKQDVVPCIKQKRGPPSEERKAKKKQQRRKKRAEKNRELGVKRLKLRPVVKPKPVTYCRHFLNGRCHEGEKCKFSHDTTPLTKSKPCCHFARHSCMKGDGCPFDHQLSKYPCSNYASNGHCSRGESCMFSHKLLPKEDVPGTSNITTPEVKSHSVSGASTSKKPEKTEAKTEANLLAATPMPKGICFLSSGKTPTADSSGPKPSSLSAKKNEISEVETQKDQTAPSSAQKLSEISNGVTRTPLPKGINFLSFGKAPLGSLTVSSTSSTGILQKNEISKSSSSLEGSAVSSEKTSTTPSDEQKNIHVDPKRLLTNPFSCGQSLDFSSQKALMSTLAFAAKIGSGMKQNGSAAK